MIKTFPSDIEIAQDANIQPISSIANALKIPARYVEPYGHYKAKLSLDLLDTEKVTENNLILVTSINPTPAGEGKTTVSIGLTDGLRRIGKESIAVLREPSLGPVFGIKGGAAGGGYSQVIPMEEINRHFTGDFHSIEKANNLLSAAIDNNLQSKTRSLQIDPNTILWKRAMDMNDRSLRQIVVGIGGKANGITREDGFNITPASEIMAILCLAESFSDLKARLGAIYIADDIYGEPVYARDLNVVGAMAILLKDAIKPNLVQTLENTPVILHGGPFASIAQGTNSVIATKMGLSLSEYVVTEAGFGADLGAEKFMNIKARAAEFEPDAVVIVATVRALKMHGGVEKDHLQQQNVEAVMKGIVNLEKHIETIRTFGIEPVVALNHFVTDTEEEIDAVLQWCEERNVRAALTKVWEQGGKGGVELAEQVLELFEEEKDFELLYDLEASVEQKVEEIVRRIYGGSGVHFTDQAKKDLAKVVENGWDELPVCMAKTQYSLSDDPKKLGRPEDFQITIRSIVPKVGAGFLVCLTGDIMTMPGLPERPAALQMDIDEEGRAKGLM
mgnify:CR=1 FL=1